MLLHLSPFLLRGLAAGAKKSVKVKLPEVIKKKRAVEKTKYVPYIPPHLLAETVTFLEKKTNIFSLLDIICSPRKPVETPEQREQFTRAWEAYKENKRVC